MEIIHIDLFNGYVRVTVKLDSRESSVLSSLIGTDICSARSRFIDISLIEKNLTPLNIYRSRRITSSGCIAVINMPEEYLEIIATNSSGLFKPDYLNKYVSFLTNYLNKIYELFESKS